MDQEVNSSILGKVDVFITLMFRGLFKWSWTICLFIIGAAALYFQFIVIFGNDAGLADVSAVEFFFFIIIAGLIWRQWNYAKKNSQSILTTMAKTFINAGIVNICLIALSAVAIFVAYAEGESLDKFMSTFFIANYLDDLIAMTLWVLIFYFSVPVVKNITVETTEVEVGDSELLSAGFINSDFIESELKSTEEEKANNNEIAETAEGTPEYQNEVKV